jgi:hypothetical protein
MALQVGGAIGVAVIGSVLATRYQDHMSVAIAGRHLPAGVTHAIIGSLGGALAVAGSAGGVRGALLGRAAREAFMSGLEISFLVAAVVALGGVVIVLVWLPSRGRELSWRAHTSRRDEGEPRALAESGQYPFISRASEIIPNATGSKTS